MPNNPLLKIDSYTVSNTGWAAVSLPKVWSGRVFCLTLEGPAGAAPVGEMLISADSVGTVFQRRAPELTLQVDRPRREPWESGVIYVKATSPSDTVLKVSYLQ